MIGIKKTVLLTVGILLVGALCLGATLFVRWRGEDADTKGSEKILSAENTADDMRNILLLGTDRQAGLCDVMMLVNVNFTDGTATVLQIPRDTYAAYTEASYKKLNGAYRSLGGAERTARFLEDAMGIDIHHYVCIGLDTLGAIVDAVGGVDVELPCNMYYRDVEQGLYIDLEKGLTHLDGELAEQFVRFRSAYTEGDLGRIDAQKLFMAAFAEKLLDEFSPALALRLAGAIDGVETDLSVSDMMSLGMRALDIGKGSIALLTLPGREVTATESGASYYVLSRPAAEEITEERFGRTEEFDGEEVFLNPDYVSFGRAYEEYAEYTPMLVGEISENGIKIQIR